MKFGFVKVAAATPEIRVADPEFNRHEIQKKIEECAAKEAKIIVLPELCLSGFTCQDLFLQNTLLEECRTQLRILAEETRQIEALIFVGLPWKKGDKLYNVAAVLNRGRVLALIPKRNIPNYGEFYEARHFTPGQPEVDMITAFGYCIPFGAGILFQAEEKEELVVGCEICEDLWVANPPSTELACGGAKILVNLSASNETVLKDSYRESLVRATSARLVAAYVYACAGEGESTQDLVFAGHNMIAENGSLLAEGIRFQGSTIYADVDLGRLSHERRRMNTYPQREHSLVRVSFFIGEKEGVLERRFSRLPFVPEEKLERDRRAQDILTMQAYGLKKRYHHTGCKQAVLGISGGLDSTLALLVTAKAFDLLGLPRANIHSITMPCFGTTDRTYDNACKLALTLGTALEEVDIKEAVQLHFRDIKQDADNHDVTYENSQARERTQVLMDIANQTGGIVIGTGDLSELALGWCTYNGDHMSMYAVNCSIPKTLVRHLVGYLARDNAKKDEALHDVLEDILDTPVSPELLPAVQGQISQKTEDLVGPYELHDFFLYYMLRWGFSPRKVYRLAVYALGGKYSREVILKWLKTFYRRFFSQQFKRNCVPDGPKVGSVALSPRGDWRMPSDAKWALWQAELETLK